MYTCQFFSPGFHRSLHKPSADKGFTESLHAVYTRGESACVYLHTPLCATATEVDAQCAWNGTHKGRSQRLERVEGGRYTGMVELEQRELHGDQESRPVCEMR